MITFVKKQLGRVALSFIVLAAIGCAQSSSQRPLTEATRPPNVTFRLTQLRGAAAPGLQQYECTYQSAGKTARFRLQLKQGRPVRGPIPLMFASGKFVAVGGSNNSVLLRNLKIALDAKSLPKNPVRIATLPFDAAILGTRQSKDSTDAFSDNPPGDWVLIKLFFPKGGDDGEMFLSFNTVLGIGEFSMKDSDYGDYVLSQLAKVL